MSRSNFSISIHRRAHTMQKTERMNEIKKKIRSSAWNNSNPQLLRCVRLLFICFVVAVSFACSCCSTSLFGWPLYFVFRIPKLETMFDHYRVFSIHSGWAERVYLHQTLNKHIVCIWKVKQKKILYVYIYAFYGLCIDTEHIKYYGGSLFFFPYRFNHKSLYLSSREQWQTAI